MIIISIGLAGRMTEGCNKDRDYKKKVQKKNWQVLIESINRAFKAICSHVAQSKKLHTQKVEMFLKLITYKLYLRITRKINFALNWITDFISNLCFKHKMSWVAS